MSTHLPTGSATRRLKNARYLAQMLPQLKPFLPLGGKAEGTIPLSLLDRIHTPEGLHAAQAALADNPELASSLAQVQFPKISATIAGPLFKGTLRFVRVAFTIGDRHDTVSVSDADIATAIDYAKRSAPAISAYAAQYGPNVLAVSDSVIDLPVHVASATYGMDELIPSLSSIQTVPPIGPDTCLVVLNPPGLSNRIVPTGAHSVANNVPFVFVSLNDQGLTVDDRNDCFAANLSHEIAEMVVDPQAKPTNPEVCDPCSNCLPVFRGFFDGVGNYLATSQAALPPGFSYEFFITALVSPAEVLLCPPSPSACVWSPNQLVSVPSELHFAQTHVGESKARTLTVENIGLHPVSITLLPAPAPTDNSFSCGVHGYFVIAPGHRLDLPVAFAPKRAGAVEEALTVTSNALGSPHQVALKGDGLLSQPA